jgi:hypothetical protein
MVKNTTPSNELRVGDGKCWEHKGIYMGKLKKIEKIGRLYDPDIKYVTSSTKVKYSP